MSKDINEEQKEEQKTEKKLSEETLHILANLVITTVSIGALVISIATGMKGKNRS